MSTLTKKSLESQKQKDTLKVNPVTTKRVIQRKKLSIRERRDRCRQKTQYYEKHGGPLLQRKPLKDKVMGILHRFFLQPRVSSRAMEAVEAIIEDTIHQTIASCASHMIAYRKKKLTPVLLKSVIDSNYSKFEFSTSKFELFPDITGGMAHPIRQQRKRQKKESTETTED